MRPILFSFFLLTVLISCDEKGVQPKGLSYRDSVAKEHLRFIDSTGEFDTTNLSYQVLDAYLKNDTANLQKIEGSIEESKRFRKQWGILDSCVHQPKIQELDADEAYRFIYGAAFCPYKINVTLSRKGDSANLHLILYQFRWDTAVCRIINEYDKPLTNQNWRDFTGVMAEADFWGLKRNNGHSGLDGDDIKVWGYVKGDTAFNRPSKSNYVERWLIAKSTLVRPFQLALKLSGTKNGCMWVK